MKTCIGCVHAEWDKTKAGKNHPSGYGKCNFKYAIKPLPASMHFVSDAYVSIAPINRKSELKDHCTYYNQPQSGN